jgi:hypothetical protein
MAQNGNSTLQHHLVSVKDGGRRFENRLLDLPLVKQAPGSYCFWFYRLHGLRGHGTERRRRPLDLSPGWITSPISEGNLDKISGADYCLVTFIP